MINCNKEVYLIRDHKDSQREFTLLVEFGYIPYTPAKMPSLRDEVGSPPEGDEAEIHKVWLIPNTKRKQKPRVEVSRLLSSRELDSILEQCREYGATNWRDYADRW